MLEQNNEHTKTLMDAFIPPQKQLLSRADLNALGIAYSNSHLILLESRGNFPKRIALSSQKVGWFRDEVFQWLNDKRSNR